MSVKNFRLLIDMLILPLQVSGNHLAGVMSVDARSSIGVWLSNVEPGTQVNLASGWTDRITAGLGFFFFLKKKILRDTDTLHLRIMFVTVVVGVEILLILYHICIYPSYFGMISAIP